MLISRQLNAVTALTFISLTGLTGAAVAAAPSSQFDLNGDVVTPGVYDFSSLSTLPATTESVTYSAGGSPVTDTYTGTALWTLLGNCRRNGPDPRGQKQQPSQLCRRCRQRWLRGGLFRRRDQSDVRRQFYERRTRLPIPTPAVSSARAAETDLRGLSSPATRQAAAMCPIWSTSRSARRLCRPKARATCRPSSR